MNERTIWLKLTGSEDDLLNMLTEITLGTDCAALIKECEHWREELASLPSETQGRKAMGNGSERGILHDSDKQERSNGNNGEE